MTFVYLVEDIGAEKVGIQTGRWVGTLCDLTGKAIGGGVVAQCNVRAMNAEVVKERCGWMDVAAELA